MSKHVLNCNTYDEILLHLSKWNKMQGQKGKCKDKKENARTTQKAIPWIAASKSSDQKLGLNLDEL